MRSIKHTDTSRLTKMSQIKSKQTIIFKHRINFINELILYKIPKSNRCAKLNQSKLKAWIFKNRIIQTPKIIKMNQFKRKETKTKYEFKESNFEINLHY